MRDAGLPVPAFFTTRKGGRSQAPYDSMNLALHVGDEATDVEANRAELRRRLDAPIAYMSQFHSATPAVIEHADARPEADALVTVTPGLAVGVLVADCVPILIHDATTGAVAAIHAGREGLQLGIVPATLRSLARLGARPETMTAAIGPAICGACYEVPQEMQDAVAAEVPQTRSTTSWDTPALDLRAGAAAQLEADGVEVVAHDSRCTRENPALFSHRRDGVTGRGAGVILCTGE